MTTVDVPIFKDRPDLSTPVDAAHLTAWGVAIKANADAAEAAVAGATAPTDTIMAAKVADAASLTRVALSATYAAAADTLNLRRLADLAASDRQRSAAASRVAYEDAASFVEQWTDFTAWSSATFAQVSAGRLYGAAVGQGGGSGANHSFVVAANETARVVTSIACPQIAVSGACIIGFGDDDPGGAFYAGNAGIKGMWFNGGSVYSEDQWTETLLGAVTTFPTWTVTMIVDLAYISIVATSTDGSEERRARFPRAGFNINNIVIFNSDTHALTGMSVGPIGARKSIATTIPPVTGIEDVGPTSHWTSVAGNNIKIKLPLGYDSRIPSPVVICFHGHGSDENIFTDNAGQKILNNALLAAGYIIVSTAYISNSTTWGAQPSLDAYYAAYQYVRDNYAIGPVALLGNSMGGIESLLTLAERRIPDISAWVGTSPTTNLADNYNAGAAGIAPAINGAYGITGGATYATQTAGHDPMLMAGTAFRGVPMLFLAATDDTIVSKAANTDIFAAKVAPYAPVTVQAGITGTGGHSFDITPYTSQIVAFFDAYTKG